jgi:hypothetical protein
LKRLRDTGVASHLDKDDNLVLSPREEVDGSVIHWIAAHKGAVVEALRRQQVTI